MSSLILITQNCAIYCDVLSCDIRIKAMTVSNVTYLSVYLSFKVIQKNTVALIVCLKKKNQCHIFMSRINVIP